MPFNGLVLATDDLLPVGVKPFSSMTFTSPIPEGAKVEIFNCDIAVYISENSLASNRAIRANVASALNLMDYNNDGVVNSHDIVIYFAWYMVTEKTPEVVKAQAHAIWENVDANNITLPNPFTDDLNGDGLLNSQDAAILIAWYQVGTSDKAAVLARALELYPGVSGEIARLPSESMPYEIFLDNMVSGLNSYNCHVIIRNVTPDYSNSVFLDCTSSSNTQLRIPWNVGTNIQTENGVVLVCVAMDFYSLNDFDRLNFSQPLKPGAYIEILNRDTGLIVARSEPVVDTSPKTLTSINLFPVHLTLNAGESYDLHTIDVTAFYDNETSAHVTNNLTWSGTSVVENVFTSHSVGNFTVSCNYIEDEISATATLSIIVGTASGTARFSKNSHGIITDNNTGLQWFCSPSPMSWYQAKEWTTTLAVGVGGWRLATIAELQSLYPDAVAAGMFMNFWTWSSDLKDLVDLPETSWDDRTAWLYNISTGGSYWAYCDNHNNLSSYHAFAVRTQQ